jgi:purine-binding chemotaxis protein CheW
MNMPSSYTPCLQMATFRLHGEYFGIDVLRVQEVITPQSINPVPLAPANVLGLMNVRGLIVTCLSLKQMLGFSDTDYGSNHHHVIIHDPKDEQLLCLLVDDVGDVIDIDTDRLTSAPSTVPDRARQHIFGVYKLDGLLISLLDIESLCEVES